jgi:hypothetical protein
MGSSPPSKMARFLALASNATRLTGASLLVRRPQLAFLLPALKPVGLHLAFDEGLRHPQNSTFISGLLVVVQP